MKRNLLSRRDPARLNIKKLTKNTSGTYLEPKSADKYFILQTVSHSNIRKMTAAPDALQLARLLVTLDDLSTTTSQAHRLSTLLPSDMACSLLQALASNTLNKRDTL